MSIMVEVDLNGPKMSAKQDEDDNDNEIEVSKSQGDKEIAAQNEEEFDSSTQSEQPGGLVGLIANLSGVIHFKFHFEKYYGKTN